jgi:hypothetical protein
MSKRPLVLVAERSSLAWILDIDGKGLSMVRNRAADWSPGFVMPQTSFEMVLAPDILADNLVQEARAELASNPSLANAANTVLE